MNYLLNTWYIAGWVDELAQGALLGRTIVEQPLVFFRDSQGTIQALADRCPHRFAPLHMGKIVGDSVQCPYHGLRFDGSGQCTHNPHGDGNIPKAACVRSFPAVERHAAIWVWLGDPTRASDALIPDFSFFEQALPHAKGHGYLPTRAHYELLSDNIMDLSHVDFLHPDTLGGGALSRTRASIEELPNDRVRISWWAPDDVPPPAFSAHLEDPTRADVWAEVIWQAPGLMLLGSGATPPGRPREEGPVTWNLHLMTPQDATNTHYFFANTRSFEQRNAQLNAFVQKMLIGIFAGEDKPMVEAQQRQIGEVELLGLNPVLLPVDAGAVRCRRVLRRLIESERTAAEPK